MPQINAGDFRKGVKIILDGEPYEMLECNFVKPGKGQALYKTRLQNLLKGTISTARTKAATAWKRPTSARATGNTSTATQRLRLHGQRDV